VLQLRCSFSTLCQGLDPVQAATAAGLPGGDQLQPQGSEQQLSPRAELAAAAAAARGASAGGGLGWMQASALIPLWSTAGGVCVSVFPQILAGGH
jgi:hypothetical protein